MAAEALLKRRGGPDEKGKADDRINAAARHVAGLQRG
jgi:hypothetical protein